MASLPTFTNLTQTQVDRITAAFTDPSGAQTPQQVYKAWLADQIRNKVRAYEAQKILDTASTNVQTNDSDVNNTLNAMS